MMYLFLCLKFKKMGSEKSSEIKTKIKYLTKQKIIINGLKKELSANNNGLELIYSMLVNQIKNRDGICDDLLCLMIEYKNDEIFQLINHTISEIILDTSLSTKSDWYWMTEYLLKSKISWWTRTHQRATPHNMSFGQEMCLFFLHAVRII